MIPTSDQLEAFLEQLQHLDRELAKLKGAEVRRADTISEIRNLSKEWLRFSESLRGADIAADALAECVFRTIVTADSGRT